MLSVSMAMFVYQRLGPMKIVKITCSFSFPAIIEFSIRDVAQFPSLSNDNSEHAMADSTGRIRCLLRNKRTMKLCMCM